MTLLIKSYEEWGNRLFPRLAFDDFIERTEKLGAKKEVKVSYQSSIVFSIFTRVQSTLGGGGGVNSTVCFTKMLFSI